MTTLFEENAIKGMKMRNRMVRSATWEGMCAPDGRPTDKLVEYYGKLASGGIGLLISGFTFVRPDGKQMPGKMGIHTDDFANEFNKLTGAVHDAGGVIAIQLVHAGGQASSAMAGRQPLAPSAVKTAQYSEIPEALKNDEIKSIVTAFGKAAYRAKSWGFDAIQLHGAHGYLINQFLSPLTNLRTDGYGGDIDNRCRFVLEVFKAVRNTVGPGFPVMIKLNATDNMDGGLTIDDALQVAKTLSYAGIDAIEVSAGTPASGEKTPARTRINKPEKEAYHLDMAKKVKKVVKCPVMVVGGFRSFEIAEKAVSVHGMDYVSLARPLIREPDLPNRWMTGDHSPAKCISCNSCFQPGLEEGGIYCVVEKKAREKAEKPE